MTCPAVILQQLETHTKKIILHMHVVSCRELSGDEGHTKVHATVLADSATSSNVNCTFQCELHVQGPVARGRAKADPSSQEVGFDFA